ncbi:MAG TPA: ABC transporter permease [Dehalococcoidia bacterium]
MSPRITLRTAGRVLRQLRHDPRTVALMLGVPVLLITLLRFVFDARPETFDRIGLMMLGIIPFMTMFLVTSVAMLRERTTGTLERLLTTPMNKLDLLVGYGIAFAVAAAAQSAVTSATAYGLLGLDTGASPLLVGVIAIATAILGMAIGLLTSAFASSEFQAVQFMPLVVMPQTILCGLITPREAMADWLRVISDLMPLTYAVEALTDASEHGGATDLMWRDVGIILAAATAALCFGALTLRRRSS